MVSIDDRLNEAGAGPDWMQRRWAQRLWGERPWGQLRGVLTPPRALPLALAGGLAVAALVAVVAGGWFAAPADAALSGSGEVTLASGDSGLTASGVPVQACGRIAEIVHTACGYQQLDHDADGIRQCVAHELKYTMWSAYGCR